MSYNVTADQAKLVMNSFSAIFQNELVSKDLVTWRKFDAEMQDTNALTVVEQVGPRYNVSNTVAGVADYTSGVQDTVFGSEQYKIQNVFGSSMGWGDFIKIRDLGAARESEALKNAAINLAHKIDAYILGFAALSGCHWTGTPGTTIADFDDIASGYTRLKEFGVPDSDLRAVLTYADKQALGSTIVNDNASFASAGEGVYRSAFDGEVAGIPTMFTQQLPTLTSGTRTNGAINGAAQNANYTDVAISGAPGQYLTQTISIDGLGANATINDGEVFTIAGVYAWDNRLGASLGYLQQFRAVGNYTATAGGAVANLRIFPALVVQGSVDANGGTNVNTANATVDSAPADNAVVTFLGTAGTAYKPRVILNKSSIVVNTADLIMPATGIGTRKSLTLVPVSIRMWQDSVFATGQHRVRFDVALSANVAAQGRYETVRINGS